MKNNRNIQLILLLLMTGLIGCSPAPSISDICNIGYKQARNGKYQEAIPKLTTCIASNKTPNYWKLHALKARAWAYFNLNKPKAAVTDEEASFKLGTLHYYDNINYALYLRAAGRVQDSLGPLKEAAAMGKAHGVTSMMTQYQLGWTYQLLGRHKEAIAAFSKGIPVQKDYGFAYYRRGLSYEALGKDTLAIADFKKAYLLIKKAEMDGPSKAKMDKSSNKMFQNLKTRLKKYGINMVNNNGSTSRKYK